MGGRAEHIAKALSGNRSNDGWVCRCPVPTHGKRRGDLRPSLLIKDGATTLLVKCFAGCDSREVLDELRRRALLNSESLSAYKTGPRYDQFARSASVSWEPAPNPVALRLWMSSVSIIGTPGEIYLHKSRGLTGPYPPSIRFTRLMNQRMGVEAPAVVAAVMRPDRKIGAVQVTFLTEDGRKASIEVPRITIGKLGTGAVRLAAADVVLGLAEGLESALSAMQIFGLPCWATLGAGRLVGVTVPSAVKTIHIFGDNDDPGRDAAERAAKRHTSEGRRVILRFPPQNFCDYNDVIRAVGEIAA